MIAEKNLVRQKIDASEQRLTELQLDLEELKCAARPCDEQIVKFVEDARVPEFFIRV